MSRSTDFNFGANIGWQDADNLAPWGSGTEAGGQERDIRTRNDRTRNNGHVNTKADSASASNANENAIDIEFVCDYVKRELRALTREVRKVAHLKGNNMDINELIKRGSNGEGGSLLHGSDVPAKTRSFKIKIKEFRQAPEGFKGAIGIVDIEEVFGCTAWALNKTNAKALATQLTSNTDKWRGKTITLEKIKVQNPSKGTTVDSLSVQL